MVGGMVGDALLRTTAVGANVAVCLLLLVAAVAGVTRKAHGDVLDEQREPFAAAMLFAALLLLRDSAMLTAFNIAFSSGALAYAALLASREPPAPLSRLRVGSALALIARILPDALLGALPFLGSEAPLTVAGHTRHLLAARVVTKALFVSIVIGGVLVALLRAGDAVFAEATDALVAWDPATALLHVTCSALFAWPILGCLHRWSSVNAAAPVRRWFHAPALDATAILAALNIVFTAFLAVQLRVLFGGQAYVQSVTGLTLAEYARSGFFALTGATAFVLLVLLVLDGTVSRGSLAASPRHRALSASLVGMVTLLLASAMARMWIYIQSFGLSTDRLYAMVAMCWITIALFGFAATVLRGRGHAFSGFAVRSAWGVLLAVNFANPDALVTRVNVGRGTVSAFDYEYHGALSADAVPALVDLLAESQAPCHVATKLRARYGTGASLSLRGWNVGDARARSAVQAHDTGLQLACASPPLS